MSARPDTWGLNHSSNNTCAAVEGIVCLDRSITRGEVNPLCERLKSHARIARGDVL